MVRSMTACLGLLILLALAAAPVRAERTVTDSAGRALRLPDRIERVFAAGAPASVLLYVLAPDRLTGWPRALRPEERDYIAKPYRDLPELGMLTGRGDTANLEVVLKVKPDMILDFGSVRDIYVSLADRVQAQTGIPYVLIDGTFAHTAAAAAGYSARCWASRTGPRQLARYVEAAFAGLDQALAGIPEGDRRRVYLARGPDGLETGLERSINTEILERAGAINVARDPSATRHGIVQVPIEQIVVWNPDTVITWDRNFYQKRRAGLLTGKGIDAVRTGARLPQPGGALRLDRPAAVPEPDHRAPVAGRPVLSGPFPARSSARSPRSSTSLFYHVDLTEAELDRLLLSAKGRAPMRLCASRSGQLTTPLLGLCLAGPGARRDAGRPLPDHARRGAAGALRATDGRGPGRGRRRSTRSCSSSACRGSGRRS